MSLQTNDPVLTARGVLGYWSQHGTPTQIADARRGLAEAKLRRAVETALAAFPPIGDECKSSIALLLLSGNVT